jgi:hypothetical protein
MLPGPHLRQGLPKGAHRPPPTNYPGLLAGNGRCRRVPIWVPSPDTFSHTGRTAAGWPAKPDDRLLPGCDGWTAPFLNRRTQGKQLRLGATVPLPVHFLARKKNDLGQISSIRATSSPPYSSVPLAGLKVTLPYGVGGNHRLVIFEDQFQSVDFGIVVSLTIPPTFIANGLVKANGIFCAIPFDLLGDPF